ELFGKVFPEVSQGAFINFDLFGKAIAEFEFTLIFADAPIDQFARGQKNKLTADQKRGALVFFGKGRCIDCHAVAGAANEMFSDFENRVVGVPQIAPVFGPGKGNVIFDGPGKDEDFGLEQVTGNAADRYKFRTSPLRNLALQPAFFHNGAYTTLEEAVAHHLDVYASVRTYTPAGRLPIDLAGPIGPMRPVLDRLDPRLRRPIRLTDREFADLVAFVRT